MNTFYVGLFNYGIKLVESAVLEFEQKDGLWANVADVTFGPLKASASSLAVMTPNGLASCDVKASIGESIGFKAGAIRISVEE